MHGMEHLGAAALRSVVGPPLLHRSNNCAHVLGKQVKAGLSEIKSEHKVN